MILAWRQQSKAAAQAHDNSRQADFLSRDTCPKRTKGSTGLTRRKLYGNRPPFFPSLTPLCIEWREKETRPEHTWGDEGDAGNEALLLDSLVLEARKRASAWVVHVFSTTILRFRLYSFIFDNG